jgi:hypothetical protein
MRNARDSGSRSSALIDRSRAVSRKIACFYLFFAILLFSSGAHADARRWVDVSVVASDDDARALQGSLHELLSRLEIELDLHVADHIDRAASGSPSAANGSLPITLVGIDLSTDPVEIYFHDARTGKLLGRREVPKNAAANLTIETTAHIVQSAVEDITAEPAPAPKPENPTPPAPPLPRPPIAIQSPNPPPPDRIVEPKATVPWGLDVGAFCDGNYMASNVGLVVGGGGAVSFALKRGNLRPALQISGSYHASFEPSDPYVGDNMKLLSLRLIPNLQLLGGESWSVDTGLGGGVDTFITSPGSATVPGTFVHGGGTYVDPIATVTVTAHFAVASSADLFLSFALPADLAPHRYVDEVAGASNTVFLPARLRPAVAFGFEFTAMGRSPYGRNAIHAGTL